jgi:hypothetical protein
MDVNYLNKRNIPNWDNVVNEFGLNVTGVKKIEERMCYDAYWEVYTRFGTVTLKMYDGVNEKNFLWQCRACHYLFELLDLQPKCFYYD